MTQDQVDSARQYAARTLGKNPLDVSDADISYCKAITQMIAMYTRKSMDYGDSWYREEYGRQAAAFGARKFTARFMNEYFGEGVISSDDKLLSNACDLANYAMFLLAHINDDNGD